MDTQPQIEHFLTLEATMQRLLDQLDQLKEETESYSMAGQSLASATDHIDTLSSQLASVASEVQSTSSVLREIGTPELLERQDNLQQYLTELLMYVEELKIQISATQQASERHQATTIAAISAVESLAQESNHALERLNTTVNAGSEMLQQETSTGHNVLTQEIRLLQKTAGQLQGQLDSTKLALSHQIRNLQIFMIVVAIIAVVVISTLMTARFS